MASRWVHWNTRLAGHTREARAQSLLIPWFAFRIRLRLLAGEIVAWANFGAREASEAVVIVFPSVEGLSFEEEVEALVAFGRIGWVG
jgi:hypothetical protein